MNTSRFAAYVRSRWLLFVFPVFGVLLTFAAAAQDFPSRPVRFMIPLAPGGGADITVRAVAQKLSGIWGQSVVVDNRPGGNGAIGLEIVARAQPDGWSKEIPSAS